MPYGIREKRLIEKYLKNNKESCRQYAKHDVFLACRKLTSDKQTNKQKKKYIMKMTLNTYDIANALLQDGYAKWTRAGASALAEYLEELEADIGEEVELDIVAIRCDFSEYSSLQDWITDYYGTDLGDSVKSAGIDLEGDENEDEIDDLIRSHIQDNGQLITFIGGIIVSSF